MEPAKTGAVCLDHGKNRSADNRQPPKEYAHRTSLRADNPYRTKAYLRAADSLAALSQPLDRIIAERALTGIPGIGDAIADIVRRLYETGTHPCLEKLREEVPVGVMELFTYQGFGPTRS